MPGNARQDLSEWLGRIAHSGESSGFFSADDVDPDAFEEFRGESGLAQFTGTSTTMNAAAGADFHAYILNTHVGTVQLFGSLRRSSGSEREGVDISRIESEKLVVIGMIRGSLKFRTGSLSGVLNPGDVLVVNSKHPLVTASLGPIETLGLAVPLDDVANDARITVSDRAVRLPETALTAAFLAFIGRYLVEATSGTGGGRRSPASTEPALHDLLRAVLAQVTLPALTPAQHSLRMKEAVRELIEKYHVIQGFDADSIARALHISRRKLYRDLADEADGIAGLIAARRVQSAAALLVEQPQLSLSDVSAAAGFGDATTMRRHFLTRLGMTPADYRKERA